MSNTLASSYKAILTGYSPFEYNQQVRNLTYNAHRAMNQTIESDRFEGLKQRYDRMQTIHQKTSLTSKPPRRHKGRLNSLSFFYAHRICGECKKRTYN